MKLSLVFDHSQDSIEFDVKYNHDLLQFFIERCDQKSCNAFTDHGYVHHSVNDLLQQLDSALTLTNSVTGDLCNTKFSQNDNRLDCLDQDFLNRQHATWVASQDITIYIDQLRFSENPRASKLGWLLHDHYPDHIRSVRLAEAMAKLGLIFPYEEVNMTVHRLESFFNRVVEFKADTKWDVFDNPYQQSMVTNNDVVNLSFGYTYVGRQYYDKWKNFDTDLQYADHYNYETLEFAFQICLGRPQTIPFSPEFLSWCEQHQVRPTATQVPIANAVDIEKNLKYYRTVLYTNSRDKNRARLIINHKG